MNYYANGTRTGKVFAQRLRGCRCKSKIPFIIHPLTKDKCYHPKDIVDAFSHYYGSLYNIEKDPNTYQPTPESLNNFFKKISLPQLTPEQVLQLNLPFNSQEVLQAIDTLPLNKSPGLDRYIGEFYKTFI